MKPGTYIVRNRKGALVVMWLQVECAVKDVEVLAGPLDLAEVVRLDKAAKVKT